MVDLRPNQLPPASEVKITDKLVIDQGTAGVNSVSPNVLFDVFAPVASQEEAEVGTDNTKRMTPLRTKQSITSEVGVTLASASQGTKADSAVQTVNGKSGNAVVLVKADVGLGNVDNTSDANKPISSASQAALDLKANSSIVISSGAGMSGGGDLTANRELALSMQSVASLAKADTAVQTVNGKAGTAVTLTKADVGLGNADNTSDLSKPISTATQTALNGKFDNPTGDTSQYIRGNGTLATFPAIPQGTVTSVGVSVPAGFSAGGSPVTGDGTIAITYAAGYQGYTTVEATKLSGVAAGSTANQTDAYLLNRANHTGEQAISTVTGLQAGLDAKANAAITITAGTGLTGGGTLAANRTIALSSTSIASLALADTSVQPARVIAAGAGLTGGGDLSANRTVALNATSIASLAKADTAVQPGSLAAVATSGAYNDLTGRPTLGTMAAKNNVAISDIAATGTPNVGSFLRGDGTWSPVAGAGTVTSVAMTVPTGLTVTGSPITGAGTLGVTYTSGYQGYTTAEATKLAGIAAGAQVNTVTSVAGKTGAVTLVKGDVGLGNVDNTSDVSKPISTATQAALDGKLATTGTAADSASLGGEAAAQWQAKIDAKAGFYNGTDASAVNFPIGKIVFASRGTAAPARNARVNVYLRSDYISGYAITGYNSSGIGAQLSGIWAFIGESQFTNTTSGICGMQRVE